MHPSVLEAYWGLYCFQVNMLWAFGCLPMPEGKQ
ncbi:hypothetical protein PsAD2_03016 [Pseudovibrio axinellae]|uniref:Uncharacterized protein n=1 Tax=Pseudovibrio axinellae TaxID=989403 RepID=A0A165XGD9_9HYPH|nr:hypothetical protein PsAD2_03016 [Pseudovibrio axinellae]SER43892.1 hypothetical protein SAMN05421798_11065 [Pseudovibrio axinellae]